MEPLPAEKLRNQGDGENAAGALGNEKSGRMYYSGSDRTSLVSTLQAMLLELGYSLGDTGPDNDGIDGVFGKMTEDAVKDFQGRNKGWNGELLKVDGLVGPRTSDALNRKMVGRWYEHYQTPDALVEGVPTHTATSGFLRSGLAIKAGSMGNARVMIVGQVPSTASWDVSWDRPGQQAKMGDKRKMLLTAPGLGAGQKILFKVTQADYGVVAEVKGSVEGGKATAIFSEWFNPDRVQNKVSVGEGDKFPEVTFSFVASVDGTDSSPSKPLAYADSIDAVLAVAGEGEQGEPLADASCTLYSPYGTRECKTDAKGRLKAEGMPPGGVIVYAKNIAFVNVLK